MVRKKNKISLPVSEGAYILLREPLKERKKKDQEPIINTSWPDNWMVFIFPYEDWQAVEDVLHDYVPNVGDEMTFEIPHGFFFAPKTLSTIQSRVDDESLRYNMLYISQTSENYRIVPVKEGTDISKPGIYEGYWGGSKNGRYNVWVMLTEDYESADDDFKNF